MEIGEKIRDSRKEKGMTIKDLAVRAAVTTGYISQIERGQIEPSLSVLRRISQTLDLPLATLFSVEATDEITVIPKDKRTILKFPELNIAYEFITPYMKKTSSSLPNMQMEAVYFKLEPKSRGSSEPICHDADELTYIVCGVLEYHINGNVYTIEEGGSIYVPKNKPHEIYNPGKTTVEGISIVSPPAY